jgi:transcriptional repressor NrdR
MKVIEKLQTIDPVAYIRYVSVYRQFTNVDEFIDLIRRMERKSANDPLQRKLSF